MAEARVHGRVFRRAGLITFAKCVAKRTLLPSQGGDGDAARDAVEITLPREGDPHPWDPFPQHQQPQLLKDSASDGTGTDGVVGGRRRRYGHRRSSCGRHPHPCCRTRRAWSLDAAGGRNHLGRRARAPCRRQPSRCRPRWGPPSADRGTRDGDGWSETRSFIAGTIEAGGGTGGQETMSHPRKNTQEGQDGFRRHRADPGMERVRRARARRRDGSCIRRQEDAHDGNVDVCRRRARSPSICARRTSLPTPTENTVLPRKP